MNHVDGDTLLKYVLETLDEQTEAAVRDHVSVCDRCSRAAGKLQAEVQRMAGIEIRMSDAAPPPLPRRFRILQSASRMAAVLAVGFLFGYLTAEVSNPPLRVPVQQRLIPTVVARNDTDYVPCEATDVSVVR